MRGRQRIKDKDFRWAVRSLGVTRGNLLTKLERIFPLYKVNEEYKDRSVVVGFVLPRVSVNVNVTLFGLQKRVCCLKARKSCLGYDV